MGARRRAGGTILLLLVAACAGDDPPPAPSTVRAPEPPSPPPEVAAAAPEPAPVPSDPLCAALGRIVDAEPQGFLALRASPAAARQWNGSLIPAGFGDCWIEDGPIAGASYACSGEAIAAGSPDALASSYLGLAAAIDACLVLPIWYPMSWQREPDRSTPAGGRAATWRAAGSGPVVTLALDEHPERPLWYVRLVVGPTSTPLAVRG